MPQKTHVSVEHERQATQKIYAEKGSPIFVQEHYFPKELEHPLSLADYMEFSASWERTNRRRHRLIDKQLDGTINQAEQVLLDALQAYADYHLDTLAPRPAHVLDHLEDRLLAATTYSSGEQ